VTVTRFASASCLDRADDSAALALFDALVEILTGGERKH
jgi:hypothetical protein